MTNTSPIRTPTSPPNLPHVAKHFAQRWVCPCCGEGDALESGTTDNYGDAVFEIVSCPKCGGKWRNEYRLFCIRRDGTGEVAVCPNDALAALQALASVSWLDASPSDSDELAAAKEVALKALQHSAQPN